VGRRKLEWSDAERRLIITAIHDSDQAYPDSNDRFLDAVVDEIHSITGRLYGAATYERLIRSMPESMPVTRRPSRTTIQKAIERAQLMTAATPTHEESSPFDLRLQSEALTSIVRSAVAPIHALIAQMHADLSLSSGAAEDASQVPILQVALTDAHARILALELEQGRLLRELGEAQARASIAETQTAKQLEKLQQSFNAAGATVETLAKAAQRLDGTERFLKIQNDAVRLQVGAESEALKTENKQLRTRIDHLLLENDQYRRALAGRPRGEGAER